MFLRLLKLSAYWFAIDFLWGAMLVIVRPSPVRYIAGNADKSAVLGTVVAAGAFVAMLAQPVFGALSDRFPWKAGRRPFMAAGVLLTLIPLYIMSHGRNILVYRSRP